MTTPEDLHDALPGGERMCLRAMAGLAAGSPKIVVAGVVGVLEAAGGPDVANSVRAHLERVGSAPPGRFANDEPRRRVLTCALRLFLAAEQDVLGALDAAGLSPTVPQSDRRRERAEFAARVLQSRRDAVQAVLSALAGGDLGPGAGGWPAALSATL